MCYECAKLEDSERYDDITTDIMPHTNVLAIYKEEATSNE